MRQSRAIFALAMVVAAGVATPGPAQASQGCHKINTVVVGTADFVANTVEGKVVGGGILHGTAEGSFTFTGINQQTGIATYEGSYVITTKHGTLSFDLFDGLINLATLSGTNASVVTGGTGRFAGATGGLFFEGGVESDGTFTDYLGGTSAWRSDRAVSAAGQRRR